MLCIHDLPRWMLSDGDAKSSPSKETACYDRYNLQKVCHPGQMKASSEKLVTECTTDKVDP